MSVWNRFWKSTSQGTAAVILLLLLYTTYEIVTADTRVPMAQRFTGLIYASSDILAVALPAGAFVGGFMSAPLVFSDPARIATRIARLALSGVLLAALCLLVLGYVSPWLDHLSGDPEMYLHQLPRAWRDAMAQAVPKVRAPMRWYDAGTIGWDLFFRLAWSVLVPLLVGVGLVTGYWARWTRDRRIVALQAWAVAFILVLGIAFALVVGREQALQSGLVVQSAWALLRMPVLVLLVLCWPTWISLRNARGPRHAIPGGVGA